MRNYIARRLINLIPLLLVVSAVVFFLIRSIPGDPVAIMFGMSEEKFSTAEIEAVRRFYGLTDPIWKQYLRFLSDALKGNLGKSIYTGQDVFRTTVERIPATLQLAVASMLINISLAIPVGIISAVKPYSFMDNLSRVLSLIAVSMPNFWLGMLFIYTFTLKLGLLPSSGMGDFFKDPWMALKYLLMPSMAVGLRIAAIVSRLTRSSMLEVVKQDYIRTARSKGLSERVVIFKHALKNALIPVVTVLGLQFGSLLGGTVIVETIFAWPGAGRLAVNSIWRRDYPMIQGNILLMATVFVLINLCVDLLYTLLDPRIRYD